MQVVSRMGLQAKAFLVLTAFLLLESTTPVKPAEMPNWVFVYYMAYDNNLDHCGPIILDALEKGIQGSDTTVTVLADSVRTKGLRRHVLRPQAHQVTALPTDNSASEEVLEDYLGWVASSLPAKRYAVVFLNHGGNLDEMCLDENPGEGQAKKWLSAQRVGPILRRFRENVVGDVALLFLQQCGRGSIDNLYNFRGAAELVLSSQTSVGAPNTYYTETLQQIGRRPELSPLQLAELITGLDKHFTNYVAIDGNRIAELPNRFDPIIRPLLALERVQVPEDASLSFRGQNWDETYFDLLDWLSKVYEVNGLTDQKGVLEELRRWILNDLVVHYRSHPQKGSRTAGWSGLSLLVPQTRNTAEQYRDYPLWKESLFGEFWVKVHSLKP